MQLVLGNILKERICSSRGKLHPLRVGLILRRFRSPEKQRNCTARQCSPLRRKFMKCSINSPAPTLLLKHLVIGQRLRTPNFSAFHWSPRSSLVSIGQHFEATRIVHLPKSTETCFITGSDQSGPNHQLLQLRTVRTAWSDLDQAVRAVHSCNSWLFLKVVSLCNLVENL